MITAAERARVAQMLKIVSSTPQDILNALMAILGTQTALTPVQMKALVTGLNQLVWTTQSIVTAKSLHLA